MLDPTLCSRSPSQWLVIKSTLSTWLMTPALVIPVLALIILLPWIIPRLRWKRLFSSTGVILLAIYLIASFPLTIKIATKGLVAFVPEDTGATADAIVVLGRGDNFSPSRVKVAAELFNSRRAPLIFTSGVGDGSRMLQLLKQQGIPEQALQEESCSQTTGENAMFTATVLQPQSVKRIILVTDPPHMLRSLLTFRNVGFTVIPHASPLPADLTQTRKAMMILYEYSGLVSYGLQGRFIAQDSQQAQHYQVEPLL
jgi:uncharacterized SAM-binding protein YcdF (DUF218 family)